MDMHLSALSSEFMCHHVPNSGSTKHSYQYRGMMDVDHLLEAVELHPPAQHSLVSVVL